MTKFISKLATIALISITIVSCQKEETINPELEQIENPYAGQDQFVSMEDLTPDLTLAEVTAMVEEIKGNTTKLDAGCIADSDVGCGSDAANEIEDYVISGCTFPTPSFSVYIPLTQRTFTYSYAYYIDGDSDINMDQFQSQFDNHIDQIEAAISPQKILFFSNVNASNHCDNERGWNIATVTYSIYLGN